MATTPAKEVSSPGRRPTKRQAQAEEGQEKREPTQSERKVMEWSGRVARKLEAQFPPAVPGAEGAAAQRQRLPPTFSPEDATESLTYKFHENALKGGHLEDNMMYSKLRDRLLAFYVQQEKVKTMGKTPAIEKADKIPAQRWEYRVEMHNCLKRLLIRVLNTVDRNQQQEYLKETYFWFFKKLMSMGLLTYKEQQEQLKIMYPEADRMSHALREIIAQKVTSGFASDEQYSQLKQNMYEENQRTQLTDIAPASTRLKGYTRRNLNMNQLAEKLDKTHDRDNVLLRAKRELELHTEKKPVRGISSSILGQQFDAGPNIDTSTQADSASNAPWDYETQMAKEKRKENIRVPNESYKFSQTEGASRKHPFETFYTTQEPVLYEATNQFAGRSNYQNYYPTGEPTEQKLETMWYRHKNKELAEKRRDEETKQFLKTWSQARGRFEAEVQRRKEHINFATNFAEARGFVRTKWKSKNFNPNDDPTQYDSSSDSADGYSDEERDKMGSDDLSERSQEDFAKSMGGTDVRSPTSISLQKRNTLEKLKHAMTRRDVRGDALEPIDLTNKNEHNQHEDSLMSTQKIVATLDAIQSYNQSLPKARKKKDSLPEIRTHGISQISLYRRDHKKKELYEHKKYIPVGMTEGYVDDKSSNKDMYSLSAKKNAIQRSSSAQKLKEIRMHYGRYIAQTPTEAEKVNTEACHSFEATNEHNANSSNVSSLSVYNRPNQLLNRRPHSATWTAHELLKDFPTYKAPAIPGGEGPPPEEAPPMQESVLPKFNEENPFDMISRDATNVMRQKDMLEVMAIHEELNRKGIPFSLNSLKSAILMPTETQRNLADKEQKYPECGFGLAVNPNEKPKKGKKGKKGKKKK